MVYVRAPGSWKLKFKTSEPREGEPRQPNKAYSGLGAIIGYIRPSWEEMAQLVYALISSRIFHGSGFHGAHYLEATVDEGS